MVMAMIYAGVQGSPIPRVRDVTMIKSKAARPVGYHSGDTQGQSGVSHDADHHAGPGASHGDHNHVLTAQAQGLPDLAGSHPVFAFEKTEHKTYTDGVNGSPEGRVTDKQYNHQNDHGDQKIGVLQDCFQRF